MSFLNQVVLNVEHYSLQATLWSTAIVVLLLIVAALIKEETETQKKLLFWPMTAVILLNTIFISGITIYLNVKSFTKGPVHWHAAFEMHGCDQEINLIDPKGFSNKIGSPTLHEHNDNWIHLEGVPFTEEDASVGKFLNNVGINMTEEEMTIPTNSGTARFKNGDQCNGSAGQVQAYVYSFEQTAGRHYIYTQRKFATIDEFKHYVIKHTGNIPPGDCLIMEFGQPKEKTDKLCKIYRAAQERGEVKEK